MLDSEPQDRTFRCPTCGAVQPWSDACRRCRCDLGLLHATLQAADVLYREALGLFASGRTEQALRTALRCWELDPSTRSRRLSAVCGLHSGQWHTAMKAALEEMSSACSHRASVDAAAAVDRFPNQ